MGSEKELTHIDLFSGIGGFTLAAEWAGFKTVVFCEKEKFCQKVLQKRFGGIIADSTIRGLSKQRLRHKNKQSSQSTERNREIPIIPEIRDFDGTKYQGATLLTGGFPCQPFSVAGQRKGKEDDRYLWPEMFRIIKEARPRWILAENVTGIIKLALGEVLSDLEGIGYDFPRDHEGTLIVPIIPACGLNAPHRRNRVWIVANSTDDGGQKLFGDMEKTKRQKSKRGNQSSKESLNSNSDASDSSSKRLEGGDNRQKRLEEETVRLFSSGPIIDAADSKRRVLRRIRNEGKKKGPQDSDELFGNSHRLSWKEDWYEVATRFCRVDDGVSDRIHRLKALGNAIVPQIAYEILKNIAWIEKEML